MGDTLLFLKAKASFRTPKRKQIPEVLPLPEVLPPFVFQKISCQKINSMLKCYKGEEKMIVCPKCGYENLNDALYCNLCNHIFRREKKEPPTKGKITSIDDLPEDIRNSLVRQKAEITDKWKEDSLFTITGLKKGCLTLIIVAIGILALIFLRFFFIVPAK